MPSRFPSSTHLFYKDWHKYLKKNNHFSFTGTGKKQCQFCSLHYWSDSLKSRQWPKVYDLWNAAACNSHMSLCFLTCSTGKNVLQNLIPRATAYWSPPLHIAKKRVTAIIWSLCLQSKKEQAKHSALQWHPPLDSSLVSPRQQHTCNALQHSDDAAVTARWNCCFHMGWLPSARAAAGVSLGGPSG